MSVINTVWHNANPMPKDTTADERLKWHEEHQKHCGCRPIPASLTAEAPTKTPPKPLDTNLDCD